MCTMQSVGENMAGLLKRVNRVVGRHGCDFLGSLRMAA